MTKATSFPTLTIIIPAFNEADGIAVCLDSCLRQTVMPEEILVVDNNSTDETAAIVKRYCRKHPGVIRLVKQTKQGVINARNYGFDKAESEILGRIDADSRLEPGWVEQMKKVFIDTEIMAASGPSYFYDSPPWSRRLASLTHRLIAHRLNEAISGHKMLWGSNMALRKSAWQTIKPHACHRRDIIEDLDLAIHCDEAKLKVVFDDKLLNGVSPRRYLTTPSSIYHYLQKWPRAYEIHGNKKAAQLASACVPFIIGLTYVPTNLGLRGYEPVTDTFSLKKFRAHMPVERGAYGGPPGNR